MLSFGTPYCGVPEEQTTAIPEEQALKIELHSAGQNPSGKLQVNKKLLEELRGVNMKRMDPSARIVEQYFYEALCAHSSGLVSCWRTNRARSLASFGRFLASSTGTIQPWLPGTFVPCIAIQSILPCTCMILGFAIRHLFLQLASL